MSGFRRRRADAGDVKCRRCMDSGSWSYSAGEGTCDCEAGQLLNTWMDEHPGASPYDFIAPAWEAYEPGPEMHRITAPWRK